MAIKNTFLNVLKGKKKKERKKENKIILLLLSHFSRVRLCVTP